ncbi:MAG: hypothetical protein GY745_03225 [Actinomycetia bacterium]|nr:hypothetical protein [Actinomycetes bacterium]MCP4084058.1 hypothetical protein [Actinomycetes bacterium]
MVDMVKKIHKKGADLLLPGEEVLGASVVTQVGQFKKSVAFGAIGGVVGAAVGSAVGGKADAPDEGTMAESFPTTKQAILAVTTQRWVLFEQGMASGGPKGIAAEWRHEQIRGLELEKGKLTTKVNVMFDDGSVAQVEAVKAAKPDRLIAAAHRLGG